MDRDKIEKDQINIYRDNFLKNKDSSEGTFQNNRVTQYLRFEKIIDPFKSILKNEISFLDVGCGCADLYQYLTVEKGIEVNYTGIDIIDDMIQHAKKKFSNIELITGNILDDEFSKKYDIIVFSGGLYYPGNINHEEWKTMVFDIVNKMFELSNIGISFNLLTTYKNIHRDDLFYLDPKEIIDYVATKNTRFFNLSHDYPLYEWTMTMWKKEHIIKTYDLPEYEKYLR